MNEKDEKASPQLHVHAQYTEHFPAKLVGTRESLEKLHKMLSALIGDTKACKNTSAFFKTVDGEEFELFVSLVSNESDEAFDELPYRSWDGESV